MLLLLWTLLFVMVSVGTLQKKAGISSLLFLIPASFLVVGFLFRSVIRTLSVGILDSLGSVSLLFSLEISPDSGSILLHPPLCVLWFVFHVRVCLLVVRFLLRILVVLHSCHTIISLLVSLLLLCTCMLSFCPPLLDLYR